MIRKLFILCLLLAMGLYGCMNSNDPTPKRQGYFRIALPERKYNSYTAECPFTFEYPQYATVLRDSGAGRNSCWLNIVFPKFRCNVYMSYLPVDTDVRAIIAECRKYVVEHEVKASAITERDVENPKDKIYGTIYDIEGNAASNMQFYLTDSTHNFIRGSLYFFAVPNKDSLEPVVNFVKEDINHLIQSFRWRQ
ncbi:MAG TPA: gliding motility lipoprotein GldD [Bacteroidia bacterium]|jgi:gliding motility-associated lipoprotein GldD|nr:gliding motility lipoprotein GldD [Bacteroidia bacterium]